MGHAAAVSRTSVLETASAALVAADDVRSLANTLAGEQMALKQHLEDIESRQRELAAALELNLAAIRAKADRADLAKLDADKADDDVTSLRLITLARSISSTTEPLDRNFLGRLRWLVMGR
jgi:hypothetical protein